MLFKIKNQKVKIGNYGKASILNGVTNNVCKYYVISLHKGSVPLIQL